MKRPHQKVTYIAVSYDGTRVVSVGEKRNFQIWNFMTGEKVGNPFQSPEADVSKVVFSFKRDLWMSSHLEGNVCVWRYQSDEVPPTATVIQCDQVSINWIAFAEDKPYMATAGWNKSVRVWELTGHTCVAHYEYSCVPKIVAISKDGRNLAVALLQLGSSNWYLRSHPVIGGSTIKGDDWKTDSSIYCVLFSPDGKTIVVPERGSFKLFAVEDPTHYYASFKEPWYRSETPYEWRPVFSIDGRYIFYWKWAFNLENLSRETGSNPTKLKPAKDEELPHNPLSPLYISRRLGHIRSAHWAKSLLVMPPDVRVRPWKAYKNMIALGSSDGRVFIMRFPEEFV
jgi:WD40 repeat protein